MSDYTRRTEVDELSEQLNNCHDYIDELETRCENLREELRKANLSIEYSLKVPDEEALKKELSYRDKMIAELEAKCRDLGEKLHETELAVEHNRHVAEEEQLRGALRYRDGVIHGLKYATRCNGVSGGDVQ